MIHSFRLLAITMAALVAARPACAQARIIDMHIHAYLDATFKTPAQDFFGNTGSSSAELLRRETMAEFDRYHIVRSMVCGSVEALDAWTAGDSTRRIIRGLYMDSSTNYGMDTVKFEALIKAGKIQVFGEIGAYYGGTTLNDALAAGDRQGNPFFAAANVSDPAG